MKQDGLWLEAMLDDELSYDEIVKNIREGYIKKRKKKCPPKNTKKK